MSACLGRNLNVLKYTSSLVLNEYRRRFPRVWSRSIVILQIYLRLVIMKQWTYTATFPNAITACTVTA